MSKRIVRKPGSHRRRFLVDPRVASRLGSIELYERLLAGEASPAMFAAHPADFRMVFCSASACALLGLGGGDSMPLDLMSCIPELTEPKLRGIWEALKAGKEATREIELKAADGKRLVVAIGFCLLQFEGRGLLAGYLSDITDLRALQDECLHLSEEIAAREIELSYRDIFENVTDGILLLDVVDGGRFRCVAINPAMAEITGLPRQDSAGSWIDAMLPAREAKELTEFFHRCVETRKPLELNQELSLPPGKKYLEMKTIPVEGGEGRIDRLIVLGKDISERKRAEREIGLMNFSLDRMNDAVFLFDGEGRIRYVNRRACSDLGYGREELLSMSVSDIDLGMDIAQLRALQAPNPAHDELRVETFHIDKNGRVFPVEISASTFDYDGKAMRLAVARDIGERRAYEQSLHKQRKLLSEAQRIAHTGSWGLELSTNKLTWSDEVFRIFEIDPARFDASYRGFLNAVHPEDREAVGLAYAESLNERKPYEIEHRLLMADGRVKYVAERGETLYDDDGIALVSLGTVQDISDRKRMENELRASEYRWKFALEGAGQGVWDWNLQTGEVEYSALYKRMLGYDDAEFSNRVEEWKNRLHPEDAVRTLEMHRAYFDGESSSYECEFRMRGKNGNWKWILSRGMVVERDDQGRPLRMIGTHADISERKRIEATLSFVAQAGWRRDGVSFLTALARHLGEALAVDYVIIDKLAERPGYAETVALYAKGKVLPNMQYGLEDTPCGNVMDGDLCCYPFGVRQAFPRDYLLVEMGVDSYAGLPLWDSKGRAVGLIAVMDGKPMEDVAAVSELLKLVAVRAAAELERDQSERALAESRLFLQQVIDTVADPIFVKDRQHRWLLLNRAYCRFMGQPLAKLLGKSDYDFFPADEAAVFWSKDEEAFEEGENVNEEDFTNAAGVTHTIVTSKTCFTDAKGDSILVGTIKDISELKQIQRNLEATADRLRCVLQTLPDYVWLKNPDGVYLACNPAFERLYGATEADIVGKTDYDFAAAEWADFFRRKDLEAMASGYVLIDEEWVELARDCGRVLLEIRKVPVYGADGGLIGVLGIGRDITERKRMEEALARSEREFRGLADNLPDNVVRWDRLGRYVYINPTNQRTIGLGSAEVVGKRLGEAFPDGRFAVLEAAIDRVAASGEAVAFLRQLVPGEDGDMRIHDINLVPEFDAAGRVASVLGIGRDMTDIYRMQEAIAEREQEFRSLAEGSPNFIVRYDRDGRIRYLNTPLARHLGVSAADVVGKLPAEVWPDGRYGELQQAAAHTVETERETTVEIREPVSGGEYIYHQIRIVPERDVTGEVKGSIVIGWDITELKRTERELALLTHAVNLSTDGIHLFDRQSRIVYANDAMCKRLGYGREELLQLKISDIDPLVTEERMVDYVNGLVKDFQNPTFETLHRTRDGRLITVEISAVLFEYHGESFCVAVERDITERKRQQERLDMQNYALNQIGDAIYLIDEDARFLQVNDAVCKALGYSREELLTMSLFDVDPDFRPESWPNFKGDLERLLSVTLESRHRRRDGSVFPVEVNANHTVYQGRNLNIAIVRDISERKRAEQLLAQREREFRTLVENLPTYVVRLDLNLRRVYVNPAFVASMGIPESELLGTHVSQHWRAANLSAKLYVKLLKTVLLAGEQQEVPLEWECQDGGFVRHIVRIAPEFDYDGMPRGLLILGFDVTERHRQQALEAQRQRVFERIAHGDDLGGVLLQVALYVEASKTGRRCLILQVDDDGKLSQRLIAPSLPDVFRDNLKEFLNARGDGCPGWGEALLRGERTIIEDMSDRACGNRCLGFMAEAGVRAGWCEPIRSADNRVLGVLVLYLDQTGAPSRADLSLLLQASHLCSIAIERKRIEQQLYRQACYDTLTGLPNRRLFADRLHEEIARAERGGDSLALLFIDLDRFKEVNDTLGHSVGDHLLVEAARRIRARLRESDIVARLAGDEFVVILLGADDNAVLERIASDLLAELTEPFAAGEHLSFISASIGIAQYPRDAVSADALLGCADRAMYAAKENGRNDYSFFDNQMLKHAQHRLQLAGELREALAKQQFEVHYQPIIDAATGKPLKAEALLRWRHPELGMIPPGQFIPIAEETDLILAIGTWVFCRAAEMAERWNTLFDDGYLRQISVNVSPRQFIRGNPDRDYMRFLRERGLNPRTMVIEITEGLLLDDRVEIQNKLQRFHDGGMQLALDDFGTGYSAMAYLKKFNIDYLKIDQSFVRDLETDPGDRAIAEAIVAMSHRLGLTVVAEGVETSGQRDLLVPVGCEYLQGYFYAKPMPADDFLVYVEASTAVDTRVEMEN